MERFNYDCVYADLVRDTVRKLLLPELRARWRQEVQSGEATTVKGGSSEWSRNLGNAAKWRPEDRVILSPHHYMSDESYNTFNHPVPFDKFCNSK